MKILALYLPQYHVIPENDEWWGKGYTEWTAVRSATPLFKGHIQPKRPLNENYYNLSDPTGTTWKEQARIAKKYGVDGFCIYHYWFKSGKQLLEKPAEILLDHPEIDLKYCFCWANETWTRTWYGLENQILMKQEYLDKQEWENHYKYLRKFFNDARYIKVDGKPMICIYHSAEIEDLAEMVDCWNENAVADGFAGIFVVSANTVDAHDNRDNVIDAYYNFEPGFSSMHKLSLFDRFLWRSLRKTNRLINMCFGTKRIEGIIDVRKIYRAIQREPYKSAKPTYPGIFPCWDNTPRRSYMGMYYKNSSPELFQKKLEDILLNRNEDFLFINAWNEWGEGCYLEPDENNGYAYLEKIKDAINNVRIAKG